ncbi:hypothetical protein [Pseudomonas sp. NFIX28]|uniref:hypothetical protein n=1 Tax=Pseudomonas sp. NFIX28 TaxID=1566235 RepID=UPI0015872E1B|nr:hypothetical protein [Pseudomonas sp. NFIX28]
MAKQVIQLGTPPTGVGGDTPRSANIKINSNFDELYAADLVSYKRANILGAVSQSGGTPTGAIFEYGSNGTGEFWKFASGLMITSQTISAPAQAWSSAGTHRYANFTAGTPATFISNPRLSTNLMDSDVAGRGAWLIYAGATGASSMTFWLGAPIGTTGSGIVAMTVLANGRWF